MGSAGGSAADVAAGTAPGAGDDAALISRSLRTPELFAVIFDRHAPAIHRYVARRLGHDQADDVVAEVFLVAFQRRCEYDLTHADARPWLYGIATNLVRRHRRDEVRLLRAIAQAAAVRLPSPSRTRSPGGWPPRRSVLAGRDQESAHATRDAHPVLRRRQSLAWPLGNIVKAAALNALVGQTLKPFTAKVTAQALKEVSDLIESGAITPVIDRTYPLAEAAAAVGFVEEGSPKGKVVIVVDPPSPKLPPR